MSKGRAPWAVVARRRSDSAPAPIRWRLTPALPLLFLGLLVFGAIVGEKLTGRDPERPDLTQVLLPPIGFGGEWAHPLGTDELGRDTMSRLLDGAEVSLLVMLAAVAGAGGIGAIMGLCAGYFSGWLDAIISRVTDVALAVPLLLVVVALVGALGPSTSNLIVATTVMSWPAYARVVRGEVLRTRDLDFVTAARSAGCGHVRVIGRHILPNVAVPLVIVATLQASSVLVIESSLSFLGLGVPPTQASWGRMLADAKPYLGLANALTLIPALALALTCLSLNALGDWLAECAKR